MLTKVVLVGPLNVPLKIALRLAEVGVPPVARAATAGFPVAEPRLETSLAKNAPTKLAVSEIRVRYCLQNLCWPNPPRVSRQPADLPKLPDSYYLPEPGDL